MPEIIHKVLKEKEGSYYTIGFTVPENVVKISVSYDYPRGTKGFLGDLHPTNTIDIGLEDADGRFLGWSGERTPEYLCGRIRLHPRLLFGTRNAGGMENHCGGVSRCR